jgi:hypothetical protein
MKQLMFLLVINLLTACSNDPDKTYINLYNVPDKPQFFWQPATQTSVKQELQNELEEAKDYADDLRTQLEEENDVLCAK